MAYSYYKTMFKFATLLVLVVAVTARAPFVLESRIEGGTEAQVTDYPFVVKVSTSLRECLGSIIRDDAILTAATCISPDDLKATITIPSTGQTIVSRKAIRYDTDGFNKNVAVILLSSKVDSAVTSVIKVNPEHGRFFGVPLNVVGWTADGKFHLATPTSIAVQPCVDSCYTRKRHSSFCLDTGTEAKHTVTVADLGGPVFMTQDGALLLVGVVSHAGQKCENNNLAIAGKTSMYINWLTYMLEKYQA